MGKFGIGFMVLFAIIFVVYIVQSYIPVLITGTTESDNIFTYLVPVSIVIGGIVAVFMIWFRPKRNNIK